jgi:hypothetical protein
MIAYPFQLLQCCLVTDSGGALILVAAERVRDFPQSLPLKANRECALNSLPTPPTGTPAQRLSRQRFSAMAPRGRADRDREGLTVGLQRTRWPWARADASDATLTFD